MSEQRRNDQVVTVRSLIKRLLVYGIERNQEREGSASSSQNIGEEEFFEKEIEAAIHMAECIYDLDWPDDMSERLESVEFLCTEPGRRAPEVQDFLETIDLGTKEDPRPIQISGLLEAEDQAKIVSIMYEFKDCFA
ncbi:hypothetical protein ACFX2I_009594 [Malus domestica]